MRMAARIVHDYWIWLRRFDSVAVSLSFTFRKDAIPALVEAQVRDD